MEENNPTSAPVSLINNEQNKGNNTNVIAGAILLAGIVVAGAILLRGTSAPSAPAFAPSGAPTALSAPVSSKDQLLGNPNAKVVLVEYADFQCPFCERFFQTSEGPIVDKYVKTGEVAFVYRDFAFLGDESVRAAEASHCAADQGKYWEYHDYLFSHQGQENSGAFLDANLKTFAKALGLNTAGFNQCLDSNKYAKLVSNSLDEGRTNGVTGTPKGFILKGGKVVATIDGARPLTEITAMLDAALK